MNTYNPEIVRKNINHLRKAHNMSQKELADLIGSHQSTVSKMLSDDDSSHFSIEALFTISQHFGVPIDELVGNEISSPKANEISAKDICSFLATLLHNQCLSATMQEINIVYAYVFPEGEDDYAPDWAYNKAQKDFYNTLYFPYYSTVQNKFDTEEDAEEYEQCLRECGNFNNFNSVINAFLKKFLKINALYEEGDLPEEAYRHVLNGYLDEVDERAPHPLTI